MEKRKKQPTSHNDSLVLGVDSVVEGEATNESLGLVGARCGWCGRRRGGKNNQRVIWNRWCLCSLHGRRRSKKIVMAVKNSPIRRLEPTLPVVVVVVVVF